MTKLVASACVTFGLMASIGCNKSPEGGAASGSNTFTISGPSTSTDVKQGETKNIDITISPGKDFKDNLGFTDTVEGLPKVTAKFNKTSVPATESKVVLEVTAASDAPLGKGKIKVTAKPGTGNATSIDVSIEIKAK